MTLTTALVILLGGRAGSAGIAGLVERCVDSGRRACGFAPKAERVEPAHG
jgi:hypothetical protein